MCDELEEQLEIDEQEEASDEAFSFRQDFAGKFFLLTENHFDDRGIWREGYAGVVKCSVGNNGFLIQACKAGFKQNVVSADFFMEARMLIFDTFDELKEAKEKRYPRNLVSR